jgi:hypothetical protein
LALQNLDLPLTFTRYHGLVFAYMVPDMVSNGSLSSSMLCITHWDNSDLSHSVSYVMLIHPHTEPSRSTQEHRL